MQLLSRVSEPSPAGGAGTMFLNCQYDGTDHELIVTRTGDEGTRLERCDLHDYMDKDGWRCFAVMTGRCCARVTTLPTLRSVVRSSVSSWGRRLKG